MNFFIPFKDRIYIGIVASVVILISSCGHKSGSAEGNAHTDGIHFVDTLKDFGHISLDNAVDSFDFQFVNMSREPLVILSAKTSCECTIAKYPKIPVMPADTSYIRVIYDGRGRIPEYFNKFVTVVSSASFDEIVLEITGELK